MTSSAESTWHSLLVPLAHWDSTDWSSAPSWKEYHHQLVPILNYITNTHLVIKLSWVFQWEDVGGNTPGSGVEIFRFPREISHILIPSSPFTVIYLGARRTKRVKNKVPQPSTPQHVLWGSEEEFSSFALGQTGCLLTAVSSHRQIRPCICLHRWGL